MDETGRLERLAPLDATGGLVVMGAKAMVEYLDAPAKEAVVLVMVVWACSRRQARDECRQVGRRRREQVTHPASDEEQGGSHREQRVVRRHSVGTRGTSPSQWRVQRRVARHTLAQRHAEASRGRSRSDAAWWCTRVRQTGRSHRFITNLEYLPAALQGRAKAHRGVFACALHDGGHDRSRCERSASAQIGRAVRG
jgi:hypothetical protein